MRQYNKCFISSYCRYGFMCNEIKYLRAAGDCKIVAAFNLESALKDFRLCILLTTMRLLGEEYLFIQTAENMT